MRIEKGIDKFELRKMSEVKNVHFAARLLLCGGLTTIFAFLTLKLSGWLWLAPAAGLGLMYCHAAELQHQCLHNTALRSRRLNRIVGILLGLPMLVSYSDYQYNHLKHHRLLGTPENKEFFNYGGDTLSLRTLIPRLFMLRHFKGIFAYTARSVRGDLKPEMPQGTAIRVRGEYRLLAFLLFSTAALTAGLQTALFLKLWLVPLLLAVPVHYLIELPEHLGCDERTVDVLKNTRTIRAHPIAVWFVNGNNHHVEHHWLPSVPNNKFGALHALIHPEIKHLEVSYWSFYRKYFASLYGQTALHNSVTSPGRHLPETLPAGGLPRPDGLHRHGRRDSSGRRRGLKGERSAVEG